MRGDRPRDTERIILLLLLPIGDTLFITPAIRAVRQRYPSAHISALVYSSNAGILENNTDLDELLVHPTLQDWRGWSYLAGVLWKIIGGGFDLALQFCSAASWLTLASRIPHRTKMRYPFLWWLLPSQGRAWQVVHATEHYADLVRHLGIPVDDLSHRMPLSETDRARAARFLRQQGVEPGEILVGIHPGGEGFYGRKRWNRRGFAQVADALSRDFGVKILLLGGKEEKALTDEVAELMTSEPVNAAGLTTLRETAALAERCALFIGNDSSPLHIAVAMGAPVVGIYGPTNPTNYHPFLPAREAGFDYEVVVGKVECSPCFHFVGGCPLWKTPLCRSCRALEQVQPVEVIGAARNLLVRRYGSSLEEAANEILASSPAGRP